MKLMKSEHGQALVIFALAAIGIFGIVALAIDGSAKFSDRRHAQNAADTAALAAALAKVNELTAGTSDLSPTTNAWATCPPPNNVLPSPVCAAVLLAGLDRADSNGYDNDLVEDTVKIYSPPISGYYSGNTLYVQVIITSRVNTYFARVVGIPQTKNTVEAVALTKEGGPLYNGASIVSLNPSPGCGSESFKVSGSGEIRLSGGGIFVNSSASCGFREPNCTDFEIVSGGISSAGSPIDLDSCHAGSITTDDSLSQFAIPDEVDMPSEPTICTTQYPINQYTRSGDDVTLYPGYFTAFPPITNNSYRITLQPGTYCIDTSIHWTSGSFDTLTGSEITLYITSGHEFDMSGGTLDLSAPTSDTNDYAGYVIILDGEQSSIEDCSINGGGGGTITGTIFTPYCDIKVNGNSGTDSLSAQVIGWNVTLNGNNSLNFIYNPGDNAENKRKIGLMK